MALYFKENCLWFYLIFYLNDNSLKLIFLGQIFYVLDWKSLAVLFHKAFFYSEFYSYLQAKLSLAFMGSF